VGFTTMTWLMTVTFSEGLALLQSFRNQLDRQGLWVLAAIAAMVGLMVHGFVDTVWYRPPISSLWWLMMALIASQWANYLTKKEQSPENELTLSSPSPN
jgi:putative inorganic carbon (HCO3(-)) transporter